MRKRNLKLRQLAQSIDFTSERFYTIRYSLQGLMERGPTLEKYETFSLYAYQTELHRLRIELFKLQRNVENLRLPALEVVGLKATASEIASLKNRIEHLTEELNKLVSLDPIRNAIVGLLDVVDSCDRVIRFSSVSEKVPESVRLGIEGIRSQLLEKLSRFGITPMQVREGDTFNPLMHQAMSTVREDGARDGTIARVELNGYFLHDKLLRPAQVVVVKNS